MAWSFTVQCPDCGHRWEGIEVSERIGPKPFGIRCSERSLFCARCYSRLYMPLTIDPNAWRKWYVQFLVESRRGSSFLRNVADMINAALVGKPHYGPITIDLGPIDCPTCHLPLSESATDRPDHLECPSCRSHAAFLSEYESHLVVAPVEENHGI